MRIRWMIIAVSSALLGTMGVAAAQRAVPAVKPVPVTPALPHINPTPLKPNLPLTPTPTPRLEPAPVIAPSPVLAPREPCTGLSAPSYCTETAPPESGGGDSSFSDLCEATPRPAWCEDPAKPKLTTSN